MLRDNERSFDGDEGDFRAVEEAEEPAAPETGTARDIELTPAPGVVPGYVAFVSEGNEGAEAGHHAAVCVTGELEVGGIIRMDKGGRLVCQQDGGAAVRCMAECFSVMGLADDAAGEAALCLITDTA